MNNSQRSTFAILVSVFFFWGFVAASNDILIPVFKKAFDLQNWQSQMISFAFYGAYFVGSLIYAIVTQVSSVDLIGKIGFQRSIALGLSISALGTLLFIPAASYNSFGLMISGLFVVGLGFSLQQTAANPFAISLGDPKKGSQRLSLAGGINNVGTTIAPLLISLALFGSLDSNTETTKSVADVQFPYLMLGLAFMVAATVFFISGKNEKRKREDDVLDESIEIRNNDSEIKKSVFKYPQLLLGMFAIFFYVGVEVATAGNLGIFMERELGFEESAFGPYVALYWGSLMIGRWASASAAFTQSNVIRVILKIILPYAAFGIFMLAIFAFGKDVSPFWNYLFVIPVLIIADFLSKEKPHLQLGIFSVLGIISLLVGIFGSGMVAVFGFISVGLFCSTLWPCIFTLAISGLGKQAAKGSSMLIMMILGGAVISVTQGALADIESIGINYSFFIGIICFAYLLYYAIVAGPIHEANLAKESDDAENM